MFNASSATLAYHKSLVALAKSKVYLAGALRLVAVHRLTLRAQGFDVNAIDKGVEEEIALLNEES